MSPFRHADSPTRHSPCNNPSCDLWTSLHHNAPWPSSSTQHESEECLVGVIWQLWLRGQPHREEARMVIMPRERLMARWLVGGWVLRTPFGLLPPSDVGGAICKPRGDSLPKDKSCELWRLVVSRFMYVCMFLGVFVKSLEEVVVIWRCSANEN